MTTKKDVDARQLELLIGLACNAEKRVHDDDLPKRLHKLASTEPKLAPALRDSLTEAMIGLILGPDAF